MAAEDDLDELEAELEGYGDDEDDDDLPAVKRLWKKYKLIMIPVAAALVFIPVILVSTRESDDDDRKIIVRPELAVEPGKPVKMAPDQPSGAAGAGKGEEGVFSVVKEGENEGKIVITAPPEDPKKPEAEGGEKPAAIAMTPEGGKKPAEVAMAPEGAEKTPTDGKSADGAILPPPTAPEKEGEAAVPVLPEPGAIVDGKSTESILPVPEAEKVPDAKQPEKPADVAAQPVQPEQPAKTTKAEPPTAPAGNNQLTVVIPKGKEETTVAVAPKPQIAPPPPAPAGKLNVTPLRTMAGVYRVQVASARSEAAAKTLWGKQVSKHPDLLGELPLTVQQAVISDRGTFYRVQGGAFGDRESADSVCRKLKSRGQDCIVVRP
jgi:hypothetical protein